MFDQFLVSLWIYQWKKKLLILRNSQVQNFGQCKPAIKFKIIHIHDKFRVPWIVFNSEPIIQGIVFFEISCVQCFSQFFRLALCVSSTTINWWTMERFKILRIWHECQISLALYLITTILKTTFHSQRSWYNLAKIPLFSRKINQNSAEIPSLW